MVPVNKHLFILKKLNILYLEDNLEIQQNMKITFELIFNKVFLSSTIEMSKDIFDNNKIDLIITDIVLENENSLDFIKYLRDINKVIPIIITTSYLEENFLKQSISYNIVDYIIKPFNLEELTYSLKNCIENYFINHLRFYQIDDSFLYDCSEKVLYSLKNYQEIKLTNYEMQYLELLLKNQNSIVEFDKIIETIYTDEDATINTIKSIISKLRNIIGKESIQNYSNLGYRLVNQNIN